MNESVASPSAPSAARSDPAGALDNGNLGQAGADPGAAADSAILPRSNVVQSSDAAADPGGGMLSPSPAGLASLESEPVSPEAETPFGLSRGDCWLVLVCGTVIFAMLLLSWGRRSGWGIRPVEIERLPRLVYEFRVDVNRATWVEWMQLEGIGETLARRIVADREERGPFTSIDDVQRVTGIGSKTLERIRPWLDCPQGEVEEAPRESAPLPVNRRRSRTTR